MFLLAMLVLLIDPPYTEAVYQSPLCWTMEREVILPCLFVWLLCSIHMLDSMSLLWSDPAGLLCFSQSLKSRDGGEDSWQSACLPVAGFPPLLLASLCAEWHHLGRRARLLVTRQS